MSSKCNRRRMKENILGSCPTQALAGTGVNEVNDILQLFVGNGEEIAAFREEESKQAIDIFVGAALPRGVRSGEEDRGL